MSLKGNFGTFYLATILQLLGDDKKTGILRVTKDDKEVQVFLQDGVIIYAKGSHTKDQLGKLFLTNGNISEKQLQECLEISYQKKQAIGKVLVEKGYVTMEMLKKNICKQAENLIFDLFLWEKGDFEYKDIKIDLKGLKIVQINTMQILLEATRRIDELSLLKMQIPSDQIVFKVSDKKQKDEETLLNETEWRFLMKVDGSRTVRQIIEETGYDDFVTYQTLNSLLLAGRIEKSEVVPPLVQAEKALAQITGLDSKKLRKELDQLGFPRSSNIRMILNRILRDAVNAEGLLSSISEESIKITANEDIELLGDLKDSNKLPFLQNILILLWDSIKNRIL